MTSNQKLTENLT